MLRTRGITITFIKYVWYYSLILLEWWYFLYYLDYSVYCVYSGKFERMEKCLFCILYMLCPIRQNIWDVYVYSVSSVLCIFWKIQENREVPILYILCILPVCLIKHNIYTQCICIKCTCILCLLWKI